MYSKHSLLVVFLFAILFLCYVMKLAFEVKYGSYYTLLQGALYVWQQIWQRVD